MIGNIVDDEGDSFGYEEGTVVKEYDWIELNVADPTLPEITLSPPQDLFDSIEN